MQLGQFTFMTPKPNKMRIGIDLQVLSRTIKHRFQQTGTAGDCTGLGPWGLAGDVAVVAMGGCRELWGAQSSS